MEQGRLLELFYDQMPAGASLNTVEPWKETIGDAQTAFTTSCQLRHHPAFPDIGELISEPDVRRKYQCTVSPTMISSADLPVAGAVLLVQPSQKVSACR